MKNISIAVLSLLSFFGHSQKINHIDPPFWWTDMPTDELQIMLHGENIGEYDPFIDYDGVELKSVSELPNSNYLVLNLVINANAEPGSFQIDLKNGKKTKKRIDYELRARTEDTNRNLGFDASDVIYLLMPDRFANGDPDNDNIAGMLEQVDRTNPDARHGGDIQGVSDHLDYIKELGMTAVWLTPTFENDMKPAYGAYHGYAATDLYKIDRRFGSNETFKSFVDKCHDMGLKVIMDMIHNHVGDQHWWLKDLPSDDWFHDIEEYGTTNFRGEVQSDPYASKYDSDKLIKGWFVPELADLDQRNPVLAKYLIQNSIWWIEYSGVDGIRMDTYVYPYKEYLTQWVSEVLTSYPDFNVVGESWVNEVAHESYWQTGAPGTNGYDSKLPSVTDFQVTFSVDKALTEDFGWDSGLRRLYYTISQDRLYADPMKNVIFLDNHDLERFANRVNNDFELFKMGYTYLMTMRGIPQVYYGTELMLGNSSAGSWAKQRADMMGGWEEDERSVFNASQRDQQETEVFEFVKKITNWRKDSRAIHQGKLTHFIPEDNTYVYFRYTDEEAVMVVMNRNEESKLINSNRFSEILNNYNSGINIMNGSSINVKEDFEVGPKQTAVFELKR
ncbi:glycoside hydrolase family 13 protein [Ekhidna sp. MALMAid0563]|uniref:glycoside hydrolase family 13 protein n=1 Tax=Ekhidna sp. MALMAid0563 TaxID=3143937 RepID=UPI0032DF3F14